MAKPDPDSREARLAAQLRRNLRRRKGAEGDQRDQGAVDEAAPGRPAEPRKDS